jgi:IMP dehydrogenase
MLNEEVRKIMTQDPVIASPNQTVKEITELMTSHALQQIPVVDDGKLMGLITSYDLWKHQSMNEVNDSDQVKDVMTSNVLVIRPKDKVGTAAELFIDRRFKTLPVVNLDNELKGVVTAFDVIKHVFKKEYPNPILYKEQLK